MKMIVFGKNCGVFANDNGELVEYYKISAVKPAKYVTQQNDNGNITVGSECSKYSVIKSVFEALPDDLSDYEDGLSLNVDFDDKKKIVNFDYL